jgi:peptidoglycan/LPS O-acetylase OafA/YrhL
MLYETVSREVSLIRCMYKIFTLLYWFFATIIGRMAFDYREGERNVMKDRIYELDWMRAFAALSVIAIHITSTYVTKSDTAYVWNQAMRYAVPLFIILSGFLLFYSDRHRQGISYARFYQRRFSKIVIPYVLWTIVYAGYKHLDILSMGQYREFMLSLGKYLLFGTGFVHLYFLIIMVQLYLVYPLLYMWLRKNSVSFLLITFIVTLAAEIVLYLHPLGVLKLPRLTVPYVIMLPLWIFYFAAGMYLAQKKEKWEPWLAGKGGVSGAFYILTFLLLLWESEWSGTYDSSMKPTVLLYCFAAYFFFYRIAMKVKEWREKVGKVVDWFSAQSFLIFLLHPLILSLLQHKESGLRAIWQGNGGMFILFLVVTCLTVLGAYVISFTPVAGYIGGVQRKLQDVGTNKVRASSRVSN